MSARPITMLALALLLAHVSIAHAQSRTPAPLDRTAQPQTTIADTVPPPPGVPNLAWLSSIEIEPAPADSLRAAFMSSFRGAFAEGAYATERERDGRPLASVPVSARFRLIEGTSGWGVWNVQVALAALPRSGGEPHGFRATIAALSPAAADAGARPVPAIVTFALEDGALRPTTWWRMAGRTTALLVLERLHHLSDDLDEDDRFVLGPALRRPDPAPPAPAPAPRPKRR